MSPPNLTWMAGQVSEENSSTVEVRDEVTIAVAAAQVNSDSSALQLVVCPAPIDAQPRIPSLHWFLLSVVFNVAFLARLILLLDKKVFNNIAPAFMAIRRNGLSFTLASSLQEVQYAIRCMQSCQYWTKKRGCGLVSWSICHMCLLMKLYFIGQRI